MCTVLLPPGVIPIAANKYIVSKDQRVLFFWLFAVVCVTVRVGST